MKKIETDFIDVPLDFRIACEAFGIMVPDFLQLILKNVSYYHLFGHDNSENDLATNAFAYTEREILNDYLKSKVRGVLQKKGNEAIPLYQKLVKLSYNRSYSRAMKQERAHKITDKLFKLLSPEIRYKPYVYLDEETKLVLNKDFMLICLVYQYTPTIMINAMMQSISLADLYARMHLNQTVFNPVLGFYLRVQKGYGNLIDLEHINSIDFKNFILDLQEFDCRYFIIRDLEKRTEVYRNRLEENFNKVNQCYDGE